MARSLGGIESLSVILRAALVSGSVVCGMFLSACSSFSHFVADTLPPWAGGLPEDAPPRPGTPQYEDYKRVISGDEPQQQDGTGATGAVAPADRKEPADASNQ
jgi:hypothetical protein